jgi:hypothetical protein
VNHFVARLRRICSCCNTLMTRVRPLLFYDLSPPLFAFYDSTLPFSLFSSSLSRPRRCRASPVPRSSERQLHGPVYDPQRRQYAHAAAIRKCPARMLEFSCGSPTQLRGLKKRSCGAACLSRFQLFTRCYRPFRPCEQLPYIQPPFMSWIADFATWRSNVTAQYIQCGC